MASRSQRKMWAALIVCGAGVLFQALPSGCAEYYSAAALGALDFCAIFNCSGGTFFDLCEPTPLFWDCPNIEAAQ